jgi:predicted CoA-binding protein
MPSKEAIDRFLAQQHLAVVGVSRQSDDFANAVYRHLREGGRTLYPVNLAEEVTSIEGDHCYHRLADVPDPVDGVLVMVPAPKAAAVVLDAIARGIPRVWLHRGAGQGAVSPEAVELCRKHGIEVIDGACPLMFDQPVAWFHRAHRFFVKRRLAA